MMLIAGLVPRQEVLELDSVFDKVVGDSDFEVEAFGEVVEAQRIDTVARMSVQGRRMSVQVRQSLALQGLSEDTEN